MPLVGAGNGWFVKREADGTLTIVAFSPDPIAEKPVTSSLLARHFIDPGSWVEILAAVTGRTVEEARAFWMAGVAGRPA